MNTLTNPRQKPGQITKVAIVLSTYNGERYLPEQLESLLAQSWADLLIVVRDDGSKDGSWQILQDYSSRFPNKFHLIEDRLNKGAMTSFSSAMEYVMENKQMLGFGRLYMLLCDQDDIWDPDKVAVEMKAMLEVEHSLDNTPLPVLIHSDLTVVSEANEVMAKSFIDFQGLKTERNSFPNMLISNLVTGCTAVINEPLARKALPIPKDAIMHDWWLALVASAFGEIKFLDRALLNYRQHDNNTIGAKEYVKDDEYANLVSRVLRKREVNEHLREVAIQADAFRECHGRQLRVVQKTGLWFASKMDTNNGFMQRIYYRFALLF
jgi:glycosyltransferase involved in cell wall biosynthesis